MRVRGHAPSLRAWRGGREEGRGLVGPAEAAILRPVVHGRAPGRRVGVSIRCAHAPILLGVVSPSVRRPALSNDRHEDGGECACAFCETVLWAAVARSSLTSLKRQIALLSISFWLAALPLNKN